MAERSFATSILLLFAFIFSLYIDSALSRSLTTNTTIDVSASIQRTHDVLSFNTQSLKQQQQTTTLSPLSPLSIYPRSAVHKHHHKDYENLTLARLARDSARVNFITAKVDYISNRSNFNPGKISTLITSGLSQKSGEYFSRVSVGSPAKPFYMALDTGSDLTWLQCKPCKRCYNQTDRVFDPAGSSSYRPVSCGSKQCSSLSTSTSPCQNGGNCRYKVSYNDKSHTEGDYATETVSLGAAGSFSNILIGCGQDNKGIFAGEAGFIGLGRGSVSLPSQIKAKSFSYCLVNRDSRSSSTLEFNSAPPSDSVMVPMVNLGKDNFFSVGLTGISVDDEILHIPLSVFQVDQSGQGVVIVDSGTTVTRLPAQAYKSLRDSFVQKTQHLPLTKKGFELYDTCYDLSSMSFPSLPVVSFHFAGDKMLPLKGKNVLVPVNSDGKFCFAFAASKDQLSIIGNVQQQGIRVSYDLANSLVGFSTDKC